MTSVDCWATRMRTTASIGYWLTATLSYRLFTAIEEWRHHATQNGYHRHTRHCCRWRYCYNINRQHGINHTGITIRHTRQIRRHGRFTHCRAHSSHIRYVEPVIRLRTAMFDTEFSDEAVVQRAWLRQHINDDWYEMAAILMTHIISATRQYGVVDVLMRRIHYRTSQ